MGIERRDWEVLQRDVDRPGPIDLEALPGLARQGKPTARIQVVRRERLRSTNCTKCTFTMSSACRDPKLGPTIPEEDRRTKLEEAAESKRDGIGRVLITGITAALPRLVLEIL